MNELQRAENYLRGELSPAETLVFKARLLVNPTLRQELATLKETLTYIDAFGKRKIRSEIAHVQTIIFSDARYAGFRQRINEIF